MVKIYSSPCKSTRKPIITFSFFKFLYLFLVALGLHCCAQAFFSRSKQGLPFIAVHRLLTAVAPLVAQHELWGCSL